MALIQDLCEQIISWHSLPTKADSLLRTLVVGILWVKSQIILGLLNLLHSNLSPSFVYDLTSS